MQPKNNIIKNWLIKLLVSNTNIDYQKNNSLEKTLLGAGLIVFSLILPRVVQPQMFILLDELSRSILTGDTGLLLLAATKLVFYNTLRHAPVVLGAFLIGEGLSIKFKYNRLIFFASMLIIPLTFRLISVLYNIQFLFTASIYVTVAVVLILYFLTYKIRTAFIKLIIIVLFLFGFDWLEIVPLLSNFGYRGGEIAQTIRTVSSFIGADYVLNYVGLTISLMIIINALIITKVVLDYYNKMFLISRLRKTEIAALHSRYFQEVKHLVHDLKTPLATIQGLNGVIAMIVKDQRVKNHTDKISTSVEKISSIISEILHDNKLSIIDVREITDFLKTYLSLEDQQTKVEIDILNENKIYANKYLLSRALINIIDNSLKAIDPQNGLVRVKVWRENEHVVFSIHDNGEGIPKESLQKIWELGFTKVESTGLGLNFVRKVIDDHCGKIKIDSIVGVGTTATISLPEVGEDEQQNISS